MNSNTKELRQKMLTLDYSEERVDVLKDKYIGETVYIVAAGPSLNNYEHDYLRNFLSDKLTFSIKQSQAILGDVTDVHFQNFCNYSNYNFDGNESTISAWSVFLQNHPEILLQNNIRCDFMMPIFRNTRTDENKMEDTVAEKGDFQSLLFEKSFERPWGPGLMYEMCIPLAIHMGVKKIVTVGWDIGDVSLYEDDSKSVYQNHFYGDPNQNQIQLQAKMSKRETISVTKSTKQLYEWLSSLNIEFEMVSDTNPGYEKIPRVEL